MKKLIENIRHFHLGKLSYILVALILFLLTFSNWFDHRLTIAVLVLVWIPVAWDAFEDLKEKKIGSELFFVAATLIALLGDKEQAMTVVLLVVMVAQYLERLIEERTKHAIQSLVHLIPSDVLIQKKDGKEGTIPLAKVISGQSSSRPDFAFRLTE